MQLLGSRDPIQQPSKFNEAASSLSVAAMGAGSAVAALLYWDVLNGWGRSLTAWLLIETLFYFAQCWRYTPIFSPACVPLITAHQRIVRTQTKISVVVRLLDIRSKVETLGYSSIFRPCAQSIFQRCTFPATFCCVLTVLLPVPRAYSEEAHVQDQY